MDSRHVVFLTSEELIALRYVIASARAAKHDQAWPAEARDAAAAAEEKLYRAQVAELAKGVPHQ